MEVSPIQRRWTNCSASNETRVGLRLKALNGWANVIEMKPGGRVTEPPPLPSRQGMPPTRRQNSPFHLVPVPPVWKMPSAANSIAPPPSSPKRTRKRRLYLTALWLTLMFLFSTGGCRSVCQRRSTDTYLWILFSSFQWYCSSNSTFCRLISKC